VLALQRSAGNRAVADQLQVARDSTVPMDTETKKGATLTFDDLDPVEIESFSWNTGGGNYSELHGVDVSAKTSKLGSLATMIPKASVDGRKFSKVDLVMGPTVIHLHDVYISTYQSGGGKEDPTITFTLDFGSIEFDQGEKNPPGKPDGSPGGGTPRWEPQGPAG
jgi:hypothetical protein